MIRIIPGYFIFLSWLMLGPSRPALITLSLIGGSITIAFFLRRSFRRKTVALLGIFGLMFLESMFLVGVTVYFMIHGDPHHLDVNFIQFGYLFRNVSLGINLLGAFAAACAAIFIEFGKSRISLSKAFPQVRFLEAPLHVTEMVRQLATSAGITVPDVCLIDSGAPSAFTVRANRKYSITLSVGLLESLENCEVEACLAHEIAHIKNHDFKVRLLATVAKVAFFAKPLSYLLEPAVYRTREYLADSTAANLIGGPDVLISALSKLEESSNYESALPSSLCVCGLSAKRRLHGIFAKHPDMKDRLKMLKELERE